MNPPLWERFFGNVVVVATEDLAYALFDCGMSHRTQLPSCAGQAGANRGLSQPVAPDERMPPMKTELA